MAQHKSAIKRIRRNDRANVRNSQYLATVRTAVKRFRTAAAAAQGGTVDKSTLGPLFITAQSMLAKAATKGILHKNNAMRKIGRLAKVLKGAETGTTAAATTKTTKKAPAKKAAPAAAKAKTPAKTATKAPAKKKK